MQANANQKIKGKRGRVPMRGIAQLGTTTPKFDPQPTPYSDNFSHQAPTD